MNAAYRSAARAVLCETEPMVHTPEFLHSRYLNRVLRYVAYRVDSKEDAEDITAEAFIAAFSSVHKLRNNQDPYPWLLGIARRKIADHLRKRRPASVPMPPDLISDPQKSVEHHEAVTRIKEIVLGLQADQREAVLLQYVDRLPIGEIAVVMRKSPSAVNSLLQRAKANIYKAGRPYFLDGRVSE